MDCLSLAHCAWRWNIKQRHISAGETSGLGHPHVLILILLRTVTSRGWYKYQNRGHHVMSPPKWRSKKEQPGDAGVPQDNIIYILPIIYDKNAKHEIQNPTARRLAWSAGLAGVIDPPWHLVFWGKFLTPPKRWAIKMALGRGKGFYNPELGFKSKTNGELTNGQWVAPSGVMLWEFSETCLNPPWGFEDQTGTIWGMSQLWHPQPYDPSWFSHPDPTWGLLLPGWSIDDGRPLH